MRATALLCTAGFVALAALVGAGALHRLDRHAVDHWMPGLSPQGGEATVSDALLPVHPHHHGDHAVLYRATDLTALPAGAVVSTLILLGAAVVLRRRGHLWEGLVWVAFFLAANVVEVVVKATLRRPELFSDGYHLVAFDSSFPSGHTLRTLLVAAAVARLWPRALPVLVPWAAAVLVLIVLDGWHVPTDVGGGILLAGATVAAVLVVREHPRLLGTRLGRLAVEEKRT